MYLIIIKIKGVFPSIFTLNVFSLIILSFKDGENDRLVFPLTYCKKKEGKRRSSVARRQAMIVIRKSG